MKKSKSIDDVELFLQHFGPGLRDENGNVPLHYCRSLEVTELMVPLSHRAERAMNLAGREPVHEDI